MHRALPICLLFLAACPRTESNKCTVSSCAGCCTADDRCELGTAAAACGEGGNQCVACDPGKSCTLGVCTLSGNGGGGGSSCGGGAGGGSATATGGGAQAGGGSAAGGGVASGGGAATGGGSASGGGSAAGGGSANGGGDAGNGDGGLDAGPATLVGITWAFKNDAGEEQIRVIDPATGQSNRIGAVTGLYWILAGDQVDAPRDHLVYLVGSTMFGPDTLYRVDEASGALLSSVALDEDGGLNWSGGLHLRADQSMVGVTWHQYGDAGTEELRLIDPSTGGSSLIAAVPKLDWLNSECNALDPATGVIYVLGYSNADQSYYIHQIDSVSGSDTLSVALGNVFPGWYEFHVRSDGRLLAVGGGADGGLRLVSVDPSLGTSSSISAPIDLGWNFGSTYDPVDDRLYMLGDGRLNGEPQVAVVDGFSGATSSSFSLADDAGYQFNWSGGLHVYH